MVKLKVYSFDNKLGLGVAIEIQKEDSTKSFIIKDFKKSKNSLGTTIYEAELNNDDLEKIKKNLEEA